MPNPVVHFEIISHDPEAQSAFFRAAFDWTIETKPLVGGAGVAAYFPVMPNGDMPPSAGINGGFGSKPEGYDGHVTFYIAVDDVGKALEKVESLGGTRMVGPDKVPDGPVIGLFKDPQGHVVGLVATPGQG